MDKVLRELNRVLNFVFFFFNKRYLIRGDEYFLYNIMKGIN